MGLREQALEPAQRAVGIFSELAETNPDTHLPNLAMSLNNLANRLAEVGRREQALEPAQRAVGIYSELAETNPDAYLPDFAMSLNNLAVNLAEVGRH
ncbi:tetratricopeptide repeat protein, partial [Saccharothrix algeriensis]